MPPEKLLRALMLQALYSIRSERQLMEQLDYNILFRWFVGLGMDDAVWSPTTFTKNRDRLLSGDIAQAFFEAVLIHADSARLLSDEHFTVDGTLLEAWASHKSFQRKADPTEPSDPPEAGGNPTVDFKGERRTNATHQSTTDPDARLYKKARGREARLGIWARGYGESDGLDCRRPRHAGDRDGRARRVDHADQSPPAVTIGSRSVRTRPTTHGIMWPSCGTSVPRRMSRNTRRGPGEAARSTAGRRDIPGMRSASGSANKSSRRLAG